MTPHLAASLDHFLTTKPETDPRLTDDADNTKRADMEEYVGKMLDNLPGMDFDFPLFLDMLRVILPEHVEFRNKQKAGGEKMAAAYNKNAHLDHHTATILMVGDLMGNGCNRRALYPIRLTDAQTQDCAATGAA